MRLIQGLAFAFAAALLPAAAHADMPGKHPAYLHALSDLRDARAHLERPANVKRSTKWDEKVAIQKIDNAIGTIKKASIDDGKNLSDHVAIDASLDWNGRMHHALELVQKAHADVNEEEDNEYAQHLKKRALGEIDAAESFIRQGIENNK